MTHYRPTPGTAPSSGADFRKTPCEEYSSDPTHDPRYPDKPKADISEADIGWARQHLTAGQSVRRRSWSSYMRIEISGGVICEFGALGVNVGHWSPLQADFLATDWELCIRGIQREMEEAGPLDAHHALITG
jgi:hypothetical protein